MIGLIVLGLLAARPADDALPSPAELFAQFQKNRNRFTTVNLQWKREHRYTDDWRLIQNKRLDEISAKLETVETTEAGAFQEMRKEAQGIQSRLINQRGPTAEFRTFLRDGQRFMLRTAPASWALLHNDDDWLMPDEPVTLATMDQHYAGFTLIAYPGNPASGYRSWTVIGSSNPGYGQVSAGFLSLNPLMVFPPLIAPAGIDNRTTPLHPIDAFFQASPAEFRTVGRSTIDGHEVIILEKRSPNTGSAFPLRDKLGPRLREEDVERAYLDPSRGALPLRIEWDTERFLDDKPIPRPQGAQPGRVLEVTEITAVPGAGFYPSRGRETTYADDPKHEGPGNTPEGLAAGTVVEIPSVAIEETTWHVAKITNTIPPGETFALEFPPNAYYYNEITGYSGRVGDEKLDAAKLPWTLCGVIVAGWAVYFVIAAARSMLSRGRARTSAA